MKRVKESFSENIHYGTTLKVALELKNSKEKIFVKIFFEIVNSIFEGGNVILIEGEDYDGFI